MLKGMEGNVNLKGMLIALVGGTEGTVELHPWTFENTAIAIQQELLEGLNGFSITEVEGGL